MPPKGFKKPTPTQCTTCGLMLPNIALRGVIRQLSELRAELSQPRPEGADVSRHARLRILHVQGVLDILIEDELIFCFGHERTGAKPGPKPKEAGGDPSNPDTFKPRKRRLRLAGTREAANASE